MRRILVIGLVLFLTAAPAAADTASVDDPPNDSHTALDIVEVAHSHHRDQLRHAITMQDPWTTEDFHSIIVSIFLPDGDRSYDRQLVIHVNEDGSFRGNLYGQRRLRGFANVYRPDERSIAFDLTRKLLSDGRLDKYAYRVFASGTFDCPPKVVCTPPPPDAAPDRGRIKHEL